MTGDLFQRSAIEIRAAIEKVRSEFPFDHYIRRGEMEGIKTLSTRICHHLKVPEPRLLDIGCGPMDKTAVFAELGFHCAAVDDLSDDWHRRGDHLEQIQAFARQMKIDFHLQDFGNYSIPFPEQSFDIVSLFAVIEHLHGSPADLLNTAGVHLKPNGLLCVTMPNSVNLRKRLSVISGKTNYPPIDQFFLNPGPWRGHVREYTLSETRYIIEATGFEILEAFHFEEIAYNQLGPLGLSVFSLLANLVPTFMSGICVLARKPRTWKPYQHDPEAWRQAVAASVPDGVR